MYSDVYVDVADFKVCGFIKNKNLNIMRMKHFFFKYKKCIRDTLGAIIWQKKVF